MRKIYSLVLMATMLLIGTNAWAANVAKVTKGAVETSYESIVDAFDAVLANETATIQLLQDANDWNAPITIENKTITLNMAGFNMPGGDAARIWIKLNGHLKIVGNGTLSTTTTANTMFIRMQGSGDPTAVKASSLEVGPNVNIAGGAYGISVYGWTSTNSLKDDYGVYVKLEGTVSTTRPGLYVEGNFRATSGNGPIFDVEEGALVQVPGDMIEFDDFESDEKQAVINAGFDTYKSGTAAIYAAGYATWNIKGTVSGANGVYVKGGHLNVIGGNIFATATEYWKPIKHGNGYIGTGSAIILDNNASYCPVMSMTITGDAVVNSEAGYAIEERITSGDEKMNASDFVIESGTFVGGITDPVTGTENAAVTVETWLGEQIQGEGTVSGGMFSSDVTDVLVDEAVVGTTTPVVIDGVTYNVVVPTDEEKSYTRPANEVKAHGTICLPKDGVIYGANLFIPDYLDGTTLYFREAGNAIEGGKGYVYELTGDKIIVNYANNAVAKELVSGEAMVGSYEQALISASENHCIIKDNQYLHVTTATVSVRANGAYIDLSKVSATASAAPGRRIAFKDANTTAIEDVEVVNVAEKVMIDGQLYIIRGEHMFNAAGQLVK